MHLHKKIAQTLLVLSILNLVFATPIVRRGTPTDGATPSQSPSPSSGGSPPHDLLLLEGSAPLQDSAPSSGSSPSFHLSDSETDGPAPVHDSTMEASTSIHSLSAADGPTPESDPITEASTFTHPLSAADGATVPESDPIAEASTSSHHSSATDAPVPVHDSTAEGSTTEPYTAEMHNRLSMQERLTSYGLSMPRLKKYAKVTGGVATIAVLTAGMFAFSDWLHKTLVDDLPDNR